MNMQRNRFLYFALVVAAGIVVWIAMGFLAAGTRAR